MNKIIVEVSIGELLDKISILEIKQGKIKDSDKLKLEVLITKLKKGTYTEKLKSITEFNNIDFEELIIKNDSEDTYFYLDPPYMRFDESKGEDDAKRLFWYGRNH